MNRPRLTLVLLLAAIIAAVYTLDVSLERAESAEVHGEASRLYDTGSRQLAAGHPALAVDPLQRAYAMQRDNRRYQLRYAEALLGTGRIQQSADLLNDIVRQAPNDGQANLLLARLARTRGDFADETSYYHRAIYGVWDRDPAKTPATLANDARLEWIQELVSRGDRRVLLGELLQLEAETQDLDLLQRVAHYLMIAGAPNRAADLYQTLLTAHPGDPALEEGLGQAETASGQYAAAERAYARALRNNSGDPAIRHDMQLSSTLSAIDPTPRRLPSREKYDRCLSILRLVQATVDACGSKAAAASTVKTTVITEADRILNLKHPDMSNEAAEQVLQLAESLWKDRPASCPTPEVLPMLMQKLTQGN